MVPLAFTLYIWTEMKKKKRNSQALPLPMCFHLTWGVESCNLFCRMTVRQILWKQWYLLISVGSSLLVEINKEIDGLYWAEPSWYTGHILYSGILCGSLYRACCYCPKKKKVHGFLEKFRMCDVNMNMLVVSSAKYRLRRSPDYGALDSRTYMFTCICNLTSRYFYICGVW